MDCVVHGVAKELDMTKQLSFSLFTENVKIFFLRHNL